MQEIDEMIEELFTEFGEDCDIICDFVEAVKECEENRVC